ncbi:hypothetical protein ATO10_12062 [Actibacterium atlanticum]|uniref:YMGG-like Gly-zipper domain-containing protein n=1 Tax=Actibacterium atlanticum TaxID=1461693 RepID=A0A058ZKD3_9RHOB|nr:hypothetical protein [Actibacterium atlanticum]KCV81647.1 hypothetical protein ATO10_12062 [Actibacterium atlanticum]
MSKLKYIAIPAMVLALAGCLEDDGERALAGAVAGALIADATGENVAAGAAIGAAGGALCDDAGVCN